MIWESLLKMRGRRKLTWAGRRDGDIPGGLCGVDAGGLFSPSGLAVVEGNVKEGDGQEVKGVAQHSCSTARLAWLLLLEVQQ